MVASALCACCGQLFWKLSAADNINIILLAIGFCLYGIGSIMMILSYRYGDVSILQPILSCSYVFSLIIGASILKEQIALKMLIGSAIVILGVFLVAKSK